MTNDLQQTPDERLAVSSRAGDFAAFEELVRRYENRIYSFLFQLSRHEADAREATQDTFVQAFKSIAQYDPGRCFASWLFTIARRKGIDCFRARIPLGGEEIPEGSDTATPSDLLSQREDSQGLWKQARAALPDVQFQALWLRYAEEMEITQIAAVLGKSQTHVKVLLFRARQKLASRLEAPRALPFPMAKGAIP